MGQSKEVQCLRILAEDTIDSRMNDLQNMKRSQIKRVSAPPSRRPNLKRCNDGSADLEKSRISDSAWRQAAMRLLNEMNPPGETNPMGCNTMLPDYYRGPVC